jgi:uroporphyrinogen decarboxylase
MRETMNSLERCRKVINGELPDRVPVCLLSFQNAAEYAGYAISDYCLDGKKIAEAQLAYWEEFRHDMIEIENGVAALAEAVGCEVTYSEKEPPWVSKTVINSLDEIHRLPNDLMKTPGITALVEATRLIAKKLGDCVCIRGDSDQGAFSLAAQIIGLENFLLATKKPEMYEKLHRLLEYANHQVMSLVQAQMEAGSHYTVIGDSLAGPDVCSPAAYRSLAAPYESKLVEQMRRVNIEVGLHICGDTTRIISDMVNTSSRYFELDYKSDRVKIREATWGKATIIGTVDPTNLIPFGTPEEIKTKAREDIDMMAKGGRFILGAGCTIPAGTPHENIRALVDAVREFGWYEKDGNLVSV